jgi:hypothetical protein
MPLLANEQKHQAKVRPQKDATRYCPSPSEPAPTSPDISASSIHRKASSMVQSMAIVGLGFVHIKLYWSKF